MAKSSLGEEVPHAQLPPNKEFHLRCRHLLEDHAAVRVTDDAIVTTGEAPHSGERHIIDSEEPFDVTACKGQALGRCQAVE